MKLTVNGISLPSEWCVRMVACGYRHTALVTTCGLLLTCGHGETGRLGHGELGSQSLMTRHPPTKNCGPPPTAHCPPPTAHRPPPTAHRPPLTAHRPPLTTHRSPLTHPPPTHHASFVAHRFMACVLLRCQGPSLTGTARRFRLHDRPYTRCREQKGTKGFESF